MTAIPDQKWQSLIDMYLESLHHWQRIVSKSSPGPGKAPSKRGMDRIEKAYSMLKTAESDLKKYETEMGY